LNIIIRERIEYIVYLRVSNELHLSEGDLVFLALNDLVDDDGI
jgi:hypothetical protein